MLRVHFAILLVFIFFNSSAAFANMQQRRTTIASNLSVQQQQLATLANQRTGEIRTALSDLSQQIGRADVLRGTQYDSLFENLQAGTAAYRFADAYLSNLESIESQVESLTTRPDMTAEMINALRTRLQNRALTDAAQQAWGTTNPNADQQAQLQQMIEACQ